MCSKTMEITVVVASAVALCIAVLAAPTVPRPAVGSDESSSSSACSIEDASVPGVDPAARRTDEWRPPEQCRLYLAPSSIPSAGLGWYTATSLPLDVPLPGPTGGIVHGILDWEFHNDHDRTRTERLVAKDYAWNALRPSWAGDASRVSSLLPGIGMGANCHFGLNNVEKRLVVPSREEEEQRDSDGEGSGRLGGAGGRLSRSSDPGAGAVSPYVPSLHHRTTAAVPAGGELFADYGERWFRIRPGMENVPFGRNYDDADACLRSAVRWMDALDSQEATDDDGLAEVAWQSVLKRKDEVESGNAKEIRQRIETDRISSSVQTLLRSCQNATSDPKTLSLLPPSASEVRSAASVGTARHSTPHHVRSLPWLRKHGRCLDNVVPRPSTMPGAGMGAFAARNLSEGDVVVPVPVLHFPDASVFDMYPTEEGPYGTRRKLSRSKTTAQLILNYCFGHPDSSMVLLPASEGMQYVNHDGDNPNTCLRWSDMTGHRSEWLDRTPEELAKERTAGLVLELVANRPVREGEEIAMDYGPRWSRAWSDHVRRWAPPPGADTYVSARELNADAARLRTVREMSEPDGPGGLPENVEVGCYYSFAGARRRRASNETGEVVDAIPPEDRKALLELLPSLRAGALERLYQWEETSDLFASMANVHRCDVVAREACRSPSRDGTGECYVVLVTPHRAESGHGRLVRAVPRKAVTFVDRPYTSDQSLAGSFRHAIDLPDDVFPLAWRNAG